MAAAAGLHCGRPLAYLPHGTARAQGLHTPGIAASSRHKLSAQVSAWWGLAAALRAPWPAEQTSRACTLALVAAEAAARPHAAQALYQKRCCARAAAPHTTAEQAAAPRWQCLPEPTHVCMHPIPAASRLRCQVCDHPRCGVAALADAAGAMPQQRCLLHGHYQAARQLPRRYAEPAAVLRQAAQQAQAPLCVRQPPQRRRVLTQRASAESLAGFLLLAPASWQQMGWVHAALRCASQL